MMTFIAVCMGLLVVEIGLILAAAVYLVLRVSKTAQAVEVLAYCVEDRVSSFKTGWIRALQGVGGLVSGWMGARGAE